MWLPLVAGRMRLGQRAHRDGRGALIHRSGQPAPVDFVQVRHGGLSGPPKGRKAARRHSLA